MIIIIPRPFGAQKSFRTLRGSAADLGFLIPMFNRKAPGQERFPTEASLTKGSVRSFARVPLLQHQSLEGQSQNLEANP